MRWVERQADIGALSPLQRAGFAFLICAGVCWFTAQLGSPALLPVAAAVLVPLAMAGSRFLSEHLERRRDALAQPRMGRSFLAIIILCLLVVAAAVGGQGIPAGDGVGTRRPGLAGAAWLPWLPWGPLQLVALAAAGGTAGWALWGRRRPPGADRSLTMLAVALLAGLLVGPVPGVGYAPLLAIAAAGIGGAATAYRIGRRTAPSAGVRWAVAGAVLIVAAMLLARAAPGTPSPAIGALLLAGVASGTVGCSLMSEIALLADPPRIVPRRLVRAPAVLMGGLAAVGIPFLAWALGRLDGRVIGSVVVIAFVVGLAVCARSSADTMAGVLAGMLLFTTVPGTTDAASPRATDGGGIIALGDSYMSGEGAREFYRERAPDEASCHRAPSAYAALLADQTGKELTLLACSGATVPEIAGSSPTNHVSQPNQLELLRRAREGTNRVKDSIVLVDGGGNDLQFSQIGTTCLAPGECSAIGGYWTRRILPGLTDSLADLYRGVLREAADAAVVVVVPYPIPVAPPICGADQGATDTGPSACVAREEAGRDQGPGTGADAGPPLFTNAERVFIYRLVKGLNAQIADAMARVAAEPGTAGRLMLMDTVPEAFAAEGLRLYDGPAGSGGVNALTRVSVSGELEQQINPANWFHNSLHPNARGHASLAKTARAWLVDHRFLPPGLPLAAAPQAVAPGADQSRADLQAAVGYPDPGRVDPLTWALAQVGPEQVAGAWAMLFGMWIVIVNLVRDLAIRGFTPALAYARPPSDAAGVGAAAPHGAGVRDEESALVRPRGPRPRGRGLAVAEEVNGVRRRRDRRRAGRGRRGEG